MNIKVREEDKNVEMPKIRENIQQQMHAEQHHIWKPKQEQTRIHEDSKNNKYCKKMPTETRTKKDYAPPLHYGQEKEEYLKKVQ